MNIVLYAENQKELRRENLRKVYTYLDCTKATKEDLLDIIKTKPDFGHKGVIYCIPSDRLHEVRDCAFSETEYVLSDFNSTDWEFENSISSQIATNQHEMMEVLEGGAKIIRISSPIKNNIQLLSKISSVFNVKFLVVDANVNKSKNTDKPSPTFYLPKELESIENIISFIELKASEKVPANTVVQAYSKGMSVLGADKIIVDLPEELTAQETLVEPSFCVMRQNCNGECIQCMGCGRFLSLYNINRKRG